MKDICIGNAGPASCPYGGPFSCGRLRAAPGPPGQDDNNTDGRQRCKTNTIYFMTLPSAYFLPSSSCSHDQLPSTNASSCTGDQGPGQPRRYNDCRNGPTTKSAHLLEVKRGEVVRLRVRGDVDNILDVVAADQVNTADLHTGRTSQPHRRNRNFRHERFLYSRRCCSTRRTLPRIRRCTCKTGHIVSSRSWGLERPRPARWRRGRVARRTAPARQIKSATHLREPSRRVWNPVMRFELMKTWVSSSLYL